MRARTTRGNRKDRDLFLEFVVLSSFVVAAMMLWAANLAATAKRGPAAVTSSSSFGPPGAGLRPPAAGRVLLGVFCRLNDAAYRREFREIFRLHPNACALSQAGDNAACRLVYAFVVGAGEDPGAPSMVLGAGRPVLAPDSTPGDGRPAGDDVVFLNIRENMNDGKSITWLYYATTHLAGPLGIDYVGKMDTDTLPFLDEFFLAQRRSLPPAPFNAKTIVGSFVDKGTTWKGEVSKLKEFHFRKRYDGVHVYPQGQLYMLSTDLAAAAVDVARSKPKWVTKAEEGHEDHDVGLLAFAAAERLDGPIKLVMMTQDNGKWWKHKKGLKLKHGKEDLWKKKWQEERDRLQLVLSRGDVPASSPAKRGQGTEEEEEEEEEGEKEEENDDEEEEEKEEGSK